MKQSTSTTIDSYIHSQPESVQQLLETIRSCIKKAAPEAEEAMSYGIPTFRLHGNLVHFGAYKHHIGFYPASSGVAAFSKELALYECSKGTIKFLLDKPIPFDLITRIVRFRVKENLQRKK